MAIIFGIFEGDNLLPCTDMNSHSQHYVLSHMLAWIEMMLNLFKMKMMTAVVA